MDTQRMQQVIGASQAGAPLVWSIVVGVLLVAACGGPGEPPPEMVPVPAGPFVMGCDPAVDAYCSSNEPRHTVTLSAYEIDRLETTQAEFQACIDAAVCVRPISDWDPDLRPDYPVRFVPWMVADAYCRWLGKRLPTEAEWEKAARGTDERIYPWGNEPPAPDCEKVRFVFCPDEKTDPVGSHPAGVSPYGAQDMAGNVSEWASDWHELTYYQTSPDTDPQGPAAGTYKIVRGGDYLSEYYLLRAADRQVDNRTTGVGIRCARTM